MFRRVTFNSIYIKRLYPVCNLEYGTTNRWFFITKFDRGHRTLFWLMLKEKISINCNAFQFTRLQPIIATARLVSIRKKWTKAIKALHFGTDYCKQHLRQKSYQNFGNVFNRLMSPNLWHLMWFLFQQNIPMKILKCLAIINHLCFGKFTRFSLKVWPESYSDLDFVKKNIFMITRLDKLIDLALIRLQRDDTSRVEEDTQ